MIFLHNLTTPTLTFNLVFYFLAPDIENVVLSIYYFVADLMLMKEKILWLFYVIQVKGLIKGKWKLQTQLLLFQLSQWVR